MNIVTALFLILSTSISAETQVTPPEVGVRFYVLTDQKEANLFFDKNQISKIVSGLEKSFRDKHGNHIVVFKNLGLSRYENIKKSKCSLLEYGTQNSEPQKSKMIGSYLSCDDANLRSPKAINFYIFDSPWQKNKKWKTSYAYFDGKSSPAVLANWETLKSGYKSPDIHEMGHVFGLDHTPACGSKDNTPTFAMASEVESCAGTGGNRKLGFTTKEVAIIRKTASKLHKVLSQ